MNYRLRLMSMFVQVVECGSISKAAEKLKLSKSVVSTALKQLEKELEVCLLKRTTRKQTLTPAGERFYLQCAQMAKQAEMAWLEASEFKQVPAGDLTVTAPHALMQSIVLPALTEVFAQHSQVSLNFISDDKHVDIIQQNIDLAVRVNESKSSNLKQRRVGQFQDRLCQSSKLVGSPESSPYIAQHWQADAVVHSFRKNETVHDIEFVIKHRANNVYNVLSMIELGLGVGVIPEFLLDSTELVYPVESAVPLPINSVYVLHPYQAHAPIAINIATQAIEAKMAQVTSN
ncbi:LysR family transcriptional regulator [Vibrio genomosp. F10 str. 9ZC157]|uniref:Transcriptional regulator n=1 Tax=Vibrio genomosp. F10 str. ZF-129 TaxID=1187848 RepID=A0A1E5B9K9_9VIBR|nr:LysR family transcriptional regulator [Vibrio genomosp. F10]OEE30599.1 transcriptional regulator [Vibrio genomosp. F10 str. ZF-129]OEE96605.1 transcriptional regulator [Vibrio genomosp. F10 str. 9ZC157]